MAVLRGRAGPARLGGSCSRGAHRLRRRGRSEIGLRFELPRLRSPHRGEYALPLRVDPVEQQIRPNRDPVGNAYGRNVDLEVVPSGKVVGAPEPLERSPELASPRPVPALANGRAPPEVAPRLNVVGHPVWLLSREKSVELFACGGVAIGFEQLVRVRALRERQEKPETSV